jgi:peptidyl-prolyl cis-trans isomerase SurA
VIAIVNKEVITWSELYRIMESDAPPNIKRLNEEERKKIFKEKEADYLETLINTKLQLQEAKSLGIKVSKKELDDAIENIKSKYSMTEDDFKESLKKEGYTFEGYRKRLMEQLITSKIIKKQISSKILVSDEDAAKYMEKNKKIIETSDSYRISQIYFKKPNNDKEKINVEEKAAIVYKKLIDGVSFGELARQYSQDHSATNGGDLGIVKKRDLNKKFGEILLKMEPGEISSPFWTEKGLHIIKFDEKINSKDQRAIKEEIIKMLRNKSFKEKYNAWIKGLREHSFIEIRL